MKIGKRVYWCDRCVDWTTHFEGISAKGKDWRECCECGLHKDI